MSKLAEQAGEARSATHEAITSLAATCAKLEDSLQQIVEVQSATAQLVGLCVRHVLANGDSPEQGAAVEGRGVAGAEPLRHQQPAAAAVGFAAASTQFARSRSEGGVASIGGGSGGAPLLQPSPAPPPAALAAELAAIRAAGGMAAAIDSPQQRALQLPALNRSAVAKQVGALLKAGGGGGLARAAGSTPAIAGIATTSTGGGAAAGGGGGAGGVSSASSLFFKNALSQNGQAGAAAGVVGGVVGGCRGSVGAAGSNGGRGGGRQGGGSSIHPQ